MAKMELPVCAETEEVEFFWGLGFIFAPPALHTPHSTPENTE